MPHDPLTRDDADVAPNHGASQHEARPRPLPAFLKMLRSETAGDPARMQAVLQGIRRYQQSRRFPKDHDRPVVAQVARARLLDFGGAGKPVVFIPSLINGPEILDLDPERSLLQWLANQGLRPLLVDWGTPTAAESERGIAGHIRDLLMPLLDTLDEPPILVGYCLGGTIALATAALRPVRALGLIAAPWDYAGFPDSSRADIAELWRETQDGASAIGLLPMEVLQLAFWQLDPKRTLAKYEAFGARPGDEAERAFVPIEDWANDGPPLTFATARDVMEDFFGANITGRGGWRIDGKTIDPMALTMPIFEIVSTTDRIVPEAAAANVGERLPLALGHVGMIVGSRAKNAVWEPLAGWLHKVS